MNQISVRTAICLLLLMVLAGSMQLSAQLSPTPYLSKDAISNAEKAAKSSIGNDAVLTYIGTFPIDTTIGILSINSKFNLDNGKTEVWGYVYYSDSTKKSTTIG